MRISERFLDCLRALHRLIWPDEEPRVFTANGLRYSAGCWQEGDQACYGIDPQGLEREIDQVRNLANLSQEEVDRFLVALAAHEVRHMVVDRGLALPFTAENISSLRTLLASPQVAEYYIGLFRDFLSERGDSIEADAHLVEMMVYNNFPYCSDLAQLRPLLLLSPA